MDPRDQVWARPRKTVSERQDEKEKNIRRNLSDPLTSTTGLPPIPTEPLPAATYQQQSGGTVRRPSVPDSAYPPFVATPVITTGLQQAQSVQRRPSVPESHYHDSETSPEQQAWLKSQRRKVSIYGDSDSAGKTLRVRRACSACQATSCSHLLALSFCKPRQNL